MDCRSKDQASIAEALEFSLAAARWERQATSARDADDRFSHRIRAEICRRSAAAALRDVGR